MQVEEFATAELTALAPPEGAEAAAAAAADADDGIEVTALLVMPSHTVHAGNTFHVPSPSPCLRRSLLLTENPCVATFSR